MAWIVTVLVVLSVGALFAAAHHSRTASPRYGLDDGRLRACPERPNCVCSEAGAAAASRAIAPLELRDGPPEAAWRRLQEAIAEEGGEAVLVTGEYLAATFRTPLFGFVDDLEARIDRAGRVIHLRSASRVGHSDLGANRARVARLAARFETTAAGGDR